MSGTRNKQVPSPASHVVTRTATTGFSVNMPGNTQKLETVQEQVNGFFKDTGTTQYFLEAKNSNNKNAQKTQQEVKMETNLSSHIQTNQVKAQDLFKALMQPGNDSITVKSVNVKKTELITAFVSPR